MTHHVTQENNVMSPVNVKKAVLLQFCDKFLNQQKKTSCERKNFFAIYFAFTIRICTFSTANKKTNINNSIKTSNFSGPEI